MRGLFLVGLVAMVAGVVIVGALVVVLGRSSSTEVVLPAVAENTPPVSAGTNAEGGAATIPGESESNEIEETAPEGAAAKPQSTSEATVTAEVQLSPIAATASQTRAAVPSLRCGGSNSFEPSLIIDGDMQTGWGAGSGDGAGQTVTIDLGRSTQLTRVGLTPGYLRVAPRFSEGCNDVLAFNYNRFVDEVEWTFDDGTSISHQFAFAPEMQFIDVDATTRYVTLRILRTSSTGDDNDTIVSEAAFFGRQQ